MMDNKESLNEYYRNYYLQNREKILLKTKERYAKSKDIHPKFLSNHIL